MAFLNFKSRNVIFSILAGIWLGAILSFLSDYKLKYIIAFGVALWFPVFVRCIGSVRKALMALLIFSLSTQMSFNPFYSEYYVRTQLGFRISLTGIVLVCAYTLWLFRILILREKIYFFSKVTLPFFFLLIWSALSYYWAEKTDTVFFLVQQALEGFLTYFYTANFIRTDDDIRFFMKSITITLSLTALLTIAQYIKPDFLNLKFMGWSDEPLKLHYGSVTISRPSGFLGHANNLAAFLSSWLPVIFLFSISSIRKAGNKTLYICSFILGAIALALTFSRGGWLAFISAVLFISFFFIRKHLRNKYPKIIVRMVTFGLVALIAIVPVSPLIYNRLTGDEHKAGESRIILAQNALKVIYEHPWLGKGLGYYLDFKPAPPHNIYIQTMAELGLIGFFLFFFMSYGFFKAGSIGFKSENDLILIFNIGIFAGLLSAYLHGILELGTIGYHKFLSYLVLGGLLVGLGQYYKAQTVSIKKGRQTC